MPSYLPTYFAMPPYLTYISIYLQYYTVPNSTYYTVLYMGASATRAPFAPVQRYGARSRCSIPVPLADFCLLPQHELRALCSIPFCPTDLICSFLATVCSAGINVLCWSIYPVVRP
jgi:hypothetical protein